jgi:hypothetical protein
MIPVDQATSERYYGNYRAKVVDNVDKEQFGRVLVYIPDIMPMVSDNKGIWARPANNPIGGRNTQYGKENHYMGSSYIPRKGAWVWIFFESGNINRPYYFGGLDLENTKVLPENQIGPRFQDKWTIFKSHEGRTIVISDDDFDQRVEITGGKRQLTNPPSGDQASVTQIDGNMTTILLDERKGKNKVLIRTVKGDYLHIDIDERKLQAFFESDIVIKTNGRLLFTAKKDIHIASEESEIRVEAMENIDIYSQAGDIRTTAKLGSIETNAALKHNQSSGGNTNINSSMHIAAQGLGNVHIRAGIDCNIDAGCKLYEQTGKASPAERAKESVEAVKAEPKGERDT